MNIFLIRHGQTLANQEQIHQYSTTELSETGKKEAELLAFRLKEADIDQIFSSPFQRAKQTAEIIAQTTKKSVRFINELKEVKRPSEIEGKSIFDQQVLDIKSQIKKNIANPDWHYSNEENFWDFRKRVATTMHILHNQPQENVLVVTHGLVIKMFLAISLFSENVSIPQFEAIHEHISVSNTGITHCEFTSKTGWRIMRVNDTEHLSAF